MKIARMIMYGVIVGANAKSASICATVQCGGDNLPPSGTASIVPSLMRANRVTRLNTACILDLFAAEVSFSCLVDSVFLFGRRSRAVSFLRVAF